MNSKITLIGALLLFFLLSACSSDRPLTKRQRLLQNIATIEQGFENRILGDVLSFISQNYQDNSGRDYQAIKKAIHIQLIRNKSVHIFSVVKNIEWQGDQNAEVEMAAAMGGKPIDSVNILTSIRADMMKFKVHFVMEDDKYKVQSAEWSWAEPSDFL